MARVAINGLGRIGRATLKIVLDNPDLELIAINDLVPADNLAYLLRYDSVYGKYDRSVVADGDSLVIDGDRYRVYAEKDPAALPWKDLDIDLVFECTGRFTKKDDMMKHMNAGAKAVILSAPSKGAEVATVVYGVNQPEDWIKAISCASCTTNCIAPVAEIMQRRIGVKKAMMTTIHAYTSSQAIVDGPNKKITRGRAGAINLVPTTTGAADATSKALPTYENKFDGIAIRAPIPVGSISDLVFVTQRETTVEEVNEIFEQEAESERYKDVIEASVDPLVSSDIIMNPHGAIIDLNLTMVVDGDLVKVCAWYDNEWGYANQMVREAVALTRVLVGAH